MELTLAQPTWETLFTDAEQQLGTTGRRDAGGVDLPWPSASGAGSVRYRTLRPGLTMFILDVELYVPLVLDVRNVPTTIEFGFNLAGQGSFHVDGLPGQIITSPGSGGLSFAPGLAATATFPADQRLTVMEIHATPDMVGDLFACGEAPPAPLAGALGGQPTAPISQPLVITHAMRDALRQLRDCPFGGATARLYQEAKALELIALATSALPQHDDRDLTPTRLRPDDVARLHRARAILDEALDNPPSLMALACLVGVNDHKPKLGFRQLFGTTVFGHLHARRMARARALIVARELSVGEVAASVGYANPSKFAAAFKRAHGVAPSDYHARSFSAPGPVPAAFANSLSPSIAPPWSEKTPAWSGVAADTVLP